MSNSPGIGLGGDVTVAPMWPQFDPRHVWPNIKAGFSVLHDLPSTSDLKWQFAPQPRWCQHPALLLHQQRYLSLSSPLPLVLISSPLNHGVNWVNARLLDVSCCPKIEVSLTSPWRETGFQSEVADYCGPERMTCPGLAERRRLRARLIARWSTQLQQIYCCSEEGEREYFYPL